MVDGEQVEAGCDPMNTHEHYWCYVHAVYGGDRGGICVRRWCGKCGVEQVGYVTRWKPTPPDMFNVAAPCAARRAVEVTR